MLDLQCFSVTPSRTKKSIEQTNVHESKIIVSFRPSANACLPPPFFLRLLASEGEHTSNDRA